MTTTQQGKPGGKPRQRPRKADRRGPKGEQGASSRADQLNQDQMTDIAAPIEATVEVLVATAMEVSPEVAVEMPPEMLMEAAVEMPVEAPLEAPAVNGGAAAALSGEVQLPQIRQSTAAQPFNAIGFQAIGQAYADYARKSWLANRSLAERFMTTRSFNEAIEAQNEFAKQAYLNFVVHSQKIGGLYGEFTRQFFRPLENFATGWRRVGH